MFRGEKVPFTKMQGLGNDFVIIDERKITHHLSAEERVHIADRTHGVGCDQLIFIQPPRDNIADIYMDMYNQDGSPLEACGNATRCVTKYLGQTTAVIQTQAGLLKTTLHDNGTVTANMGMIETHWDRVPISQDYQWDKIPALDIGYDLPQGYVAAIGNPHIVFVVEDVMAIPLEEIGPKIENHPLFPNRINVECVQILDDDTVRMRVWERGVGITMACGSGASATGFVVTKKGFVSSNTVTVQMDGGNLVIENSQDGILMTGPAAYVFEGFYYRSIKAEQRKTA